MTTRVRTVDPDMTLTDLERFFVSARLGGAPVVEDGKLVGVVSRSDVVRQIVVERTRAEYATDEHTEPGSWHFMPDDETTDWIGDAVADHLEHLCVRDVMISHVVTVAPDTPIVDVARTMVQQRVHRVIVTEGDAVRGILSSTDLMKLIADGRAKP
jgi:CBS domain-containing protein